MNGVDYMPTIPTIITGTNGVIYQGYPPSQFGPWLQHLHGSAPHYYIILGGYKYFIEPKIQGPSYSQTFIGIPIFSTH